LKILLDTQCWLWMLAEPERLRESARGLLASPDNEIFVSAASSWEIAIKYSIGRLPLPAEPAVLVPRWLADSRVSSLPIEHEHALQVSRLPHHHRDPFDRILIAQAQIERLPILTTDRQLASYDVELLPA
jgi:PIN domain nuclease of toxin-antitoxin system